MQVILAQCTCAASLHLLKIVLAAYVAHENQTLDGLNISAGGYHINGNSNSGVIVIAEGAENGLRVFCRVSNLLAELIALAKLFTDDLNNIISMAVSLGKYKGLWNFLAARKERGIKVILESADNCAYLAWINNIFIKLRRAVIHIFVKLRPTLFS